MNGTESLPAVSEATVKDSSVTPKARTASQRRRMPFSRGESEALISMCAN